MPCTRRNNHPPSRKHTYTYVYYMYACIILYFIVLCMSVCVFVVFTIRIVTTFTMDILPCYVNYVYTRTGGRTPPAGAYAC